MAAKNKKPEHRYINDLRRFEFLQSSAANRQLNLPLLAVAVVFLALVGFLVAQFLPVGPDQAFILVAAAMVGGYMALNIGANDVANNMGPAVGGHVITIGTAVAIAAICEAAGALLAGGDVVSTVSKGIISPGDRLMAAEFQLLMLAALLSAALWINLATMLNAPVSTTHSIVGGILGAGIAAAGLLVVNWKTMAAIAASWVISPVFGGVIAALMLLVIKNRVMNQPDRLEAARRWLPVLIALMAGALTAYMALKGLKRVWKPGMGEVVIYSLLAIGLGWLASRPYIAAKSARLSNRKKDIYTLFHFPLLVGVSLLCFAHGANDVANAVGPLAAIVSTIGASGAVAAKVSIPFWVMLVGASGIALGLALFGPKLIRTVGEKITRLNAPRAYCVALSSAITVLIATTLGLPVSSTHIAVGAIFGVGFLREFLENPNRRQLRPGHKINQTAEDAFANLNNRLRRRLVRRRFLYSIAAAWVITVPASAFLAGILFYLMRMILLSTG